MIKRSRFFRKLNPVAGQARPAVIARSEATRQSGDSSTEPVLSKVEGLGMTKGVGKLLVKLALWIISSGKFLITHKLTRASLKATWLLFKHTFWHFLSFALLLSLYLIDTQIVLKLSRLRWIPAFPTRGLASSKRRAGMTDRLNLKFHPAWAKFYTRAVSFLNNTQQNSISRLDLIELSIRNMQTKKVRSMVTVGGMAIGIGAIVFLVSIGYGLQQLVITRVARLDEMRQTDVSPQSGSKVKINDKTLNSLKDIPEVGMALPLIAVVGRISYQSSVSDTAVYGVTSDYLKQSAIKPVEGKIFDSNELSMVVPDRKDQVLGVSTDSSQPSASNNIGDKIADVEFSINPNEWIRVRESPSAAAKILGYTKRVEGKYQGEKVWGGTYLSDSNDGKAGADSDGKPLGIWIKADVLLWKQESCDKEKGDCEAGRYKVLREPDNSQTQKKGYIARMNLVFKDTTVKPSSLNSAKVLGVTSTQTDASGSANLDFVEIASESGVIKTPEAKTVTLSSAAKKQAIVNRSLLKILGIKENEAIGKKFSASFVILGELTDDSQQKVESQAEDYTILGVTPDEKTPVFYVPFVDLRSLGVTNYSQVKVVVKDQGSLAKTRRQIEAMGYATRSVADTVAQINSLFNTLRTILALLGMVALAVAALGMFNTLTVSLLERTREVGLMKAMGMKSSEVQELFLTESMIMGFFGGIIGIILGFLMGKLLGVILSVFAIFKGVGFVDVSYIPFTFVLAVIFLSLLVGIGTGIYPAKRATKISALNALRYE
ncbi:ABC transporter permease [Candidatus Daviesbacteria bacterium]|nr:ABC transporter permease [Candidatus Daviesbacteria bacterium]